MSACARAGERLVRRVCALAQATRLHNQEDEEVEVGHSAELLEEVDREERQPGVLAR